jgi:bacitracin synthase 3
MIIGILAILKSGGAYVPIDPNYPEKRKNSIYKQISARLTINQDILDEFLMVRSLYSSKNQCININSDSLVYCMFTSGSTGNPKGVLIEHKMLVNSTLSRNSVYKDMQKKGILLYSFSFDSSVNLTFRLLTSGGCLVIYNANQLDLADLSDSIRKDQIDTLTIPPNIYDSLLSYEGMSSLKCVIVAGEECKSKVLKKHFECLPQAKLYNEYGPTECVVWCTYKLFEHPTDKVTIGKPVPSYKIYLLEVNSDKLVPFGSIGEICVGGISVGRGYLDDEKLSREKFIDNPYKPGERLYRTGDLGRWDSKFELEYLGRIDNQVKIRGYRVELKEIENAILEYENNDEVVVVFNKNQFEDGRLIAYVKSQNNNLDLLNELRKKLPDYMVPDNIVWMKDMPLTPHLKIDYKNLPHPEENLNKQIILPRNKIEEEIYQIWKVVLGNNSEIISVTDYFFSLGGNSIRAIKLLALIYKKFGQKIEISFLFEKGTIESIAQYINDKHRFLINSGYQEIKF